MKVIDDFDWGYSIPLKEKADAARMNIENVINTQINIDELVIEKAKRKRAS